jgi:hypothetical protein
VIHRLQLLPDVCDRLLNLRWIFAVELLGN